MQPSTLTLIHDLADAIALSDDVAAFDALTALADRLGRPAAITLAKALAAEARPLEAVLEREILANCA